MLEIVFVLTFILFAGLLIAKIVKKLKLPFATTIIALIFILSPIIIGALFWAYFGALPEETVPDVMGIPFEEARGRLEGLGLKVKVAGNVYDTEIPEGSVAYQKPEGGKRVKVGRVINVKICSKERVYVPNLVNRQIDSAQAEIVSTNLKIGAISYETNRSVIEGTVLAQEPQPGEEVEVESVVDLMISTSAEVIDNDTNMEKKND